MNSIACLVDKPPLDVLAKNTLLMLLRWFCSAEAIVDHQADLSAPRRGKPSSLKFCCYAEFSCIN